MGPVRHFHKGYLDSDMIKKSLYRLGFHRDIFSHSRFHKITRQFVRGKVKTLEIGTGGGPFSVELLARENILTIVEIDKDTAKKTFDKLARYYPQALVDLRIGHANKVSLGADYHQIILLEVLEHIKDDRLLLRRIYEALEPGGRLLISTPTATAGLLKKDYVTPVEDGDHVRVGYDGPELDSYLRESGFVTIYRDYYGYWYARAIQEMQRWCDKLPNIRLRLIAKAGLVILYKCTSFLDLFYRKFPAGQITLAVKK